MKNLSKFKKSINKKQEIKIIRGDYLITDIITGEIIKPNINKSRFNLSLTNNKEFMKKWTDRKLNIEIKRSLSLLEKEILFDILDYIDSYNEINFNALSEDFEYSASKISKAKKGLSNKGLIKKKGKQFFLNPIVGIKSKEINNDLIELFKDEFIKYNIDIK